MRNYRPIGRFRIPPAFWSLLWGTVADRCQASLVPPRLRGLEGALMVTEVAPGKDVYLALDATDARNFQDLLEDWLSDPESPLGLIGGYRRTATRLIDQLARALRAVEAHRLVEGADADQEARVRDGWAMRRLNVAPSSSGAPPALLV